MTPDEARELLEPVVQQMAASLADDDEDERGPTMLDGWVLVTSSTWMSDGDSTGSTVRVTPRDHQADHVTTGLLRYAEKLMWETL